MEILATPMYGAIVETINKNVRAHIRESDMLFAVRDYLRDQGFEYSITSDFVSAEMWTALDNLVASWVNCLEPEISLEETDQEVNALVCSLALNEDQIWKFFKHLDEKVCLSDKNLIRMILWG
jgi:hypothetical protein